MTALLSFVGELMENAILNRNLFLILFLPAFSSLSVRQNPEISTPLFCQLFCLSIVVIYWSSALS